MQMHDDDRDNDQPPTAERIRAEREALQAEMERRRIQIDRDEALAWAKQHNAAREAEPVTKSYNYAAPAKRAHARVSAPATLTAEWQRFIETRIRAESRTLERIMAKGIAPVILAEERARIAECAGLRSTIDELRERLERLEVSRGLRAVSS